MWLHPSGPVVIGYLIRQVRAIDCGDPYVTLGRPRGLVWPDLVPAYTRRGFRGGDDELRKSAGASHEGGADGVVGPQRKGWPSGHNSTPRAPAGSNGDSGLECAKGDILVYVLPRELRVARCARGRTGRGTVAARDRSWG